MFTTQKHIYSSKFTSLYLAWAQVIYQMHGKILKPQCRAAPIFTAWLFWHTTHRNVMMKITLQWNLSYPDPTYPDSRLTEYGNDCSIREVTVLLGS